MTGLAVVSVVAVGLWVALRTRSHDRPELAPLLEVCETEPCRFDEARLAGFAWAPVPSPPRCADSIASPDIRIAEARIEKRVREHESPEGSAALGVARLAIGSVDEAVTLLEEAVRARPDSAILQTDLSAAYLTRARRLDRPDDLPRALAAAERAIAADPQLSAAYFNRALALESLALRDRALQAWAEFRRVEHDDDWLREAATREADLVARPAPAAPDNQTRREHIERVLLSRWATAWLDGDRQAADAALAEADSAAAMLVQAGGDAMARDAVAAIRRALQAGDQAVVSALAHGHRAYAAAYEVLNADDLAGAARHMEEASRHFRRAGSPWAHWGPIFRATFLWTQGTPRQALQLLEQVPVETLPPDYLHIRGRHLWTAASSLALLGRYDLTRELSRQALAAFTRAGEFEYLTVHHSYVAESSWMLGDRTGAWRELLAALPGVSRLPPVARRDAIPVRGAVFALDDGLPEAALHFTEMLLDLLANSDRATSLSQAYMHRALLQARLGRRDAALADLEKASAAAARISTPGVRARDLAENDEIHAEVLIPVDPGQAIAHVDRAIAWVEQTGVRARLANMLALRARAHLARGDESAAAADLRRAVDAFERDRDLLRAGVDRLFAYHGERRAYAELLALELRRGNRDEALRVLERSHAAGLDVPGGHVDPLSARTRLPDDVAFVYLAAREPRSVLWVLTRDDMVMVESPHGTGELARAVDRVRRLVLDGASFAQMAPAAVPIVDAVVRPMLRAVGTRRTIVFVPDGPLHSLPLGILPDGDGRPLVASRRVLTAPSMTAFLSASTRLQSFEPTSVLAVGDGHRPEDSGLPRLPYADAEAREVAAIYPAARLLVETDANVARMLEREEAVLHFAGHAVASQRMPVLSRLLLAPDGSPVRGARPTGELSGVEILTRRFTRTRVVVLGTCEGAAGRMVDGEGALSLATLFLRAGAGAVVASYWPVEDRVHPVLVGLHRELRRLRDPAAALRAAQLEILAAEGENAPVRSWGAFVAVGGLVPGAAGES